MARKIIVYEDEKKEIVLLGIKNQSIVQYVVIYVNSFLSFFLSYVVLMLNN